MNAKPAAVPMLWWDVAHRGKLAPAGFLLLALCRAQTPTSGEATFGVTVVDNTGLEGKIYLLKANSQKLPNFRKLKSQGSIYTPELNIPPRHFTDGFPGVTDRFEWFAIDYAGRFWIEQPGLYRFALTSDDGAKLYIDDRVLIDNDGIHPAVRLEGGAELAGGVHRIRVSYFQGPRDEVALILEVSRKGEDWRIFNTHEFRPAHADGWKATPDGDAAAKRGTCEDPISAGPNTWSFPVPPEDELQPMRHPRIDSPIPGGISASPEVSYRDTSS